MVRKALAALLLVGLLALPNMVGCSSRTEFPGGVFGTVFDDTNANGIRDDDERGVKGVLVSNGTYCRSTDKAGGYNLPAEGSLVYITTPRDYTPTGPWYAAPSDNEIDFGLKYAPEKDSSDFTFVQMSDIHLDEDHTAAFGGLINELVELAPAFVMATGDLIAEGNGASIAEVERWFNIYENATSALTMPLYNALGNHDVIGIYNEEADPTDPGYGEGAYAARFGPTYYSFDWGNCHCIVLDPNDLVDGKQVYQISGAQLQWLKEDLAHSKGARPLVFYHEPTASWRNRAEVLKLLKGRSARLFCGHLHQDIVTRATDVSEQITGAVCGEWWYGANPDGEPAGYRIVSVSGDEVDSLYKGTGNERTIDPGLTPIVNGVVELAIKIHSHHGPISEASYQVDDGQPVDMVLEDGRPWAVATASWDTASQAEGYHQVTVEAIDSGGTFREQVEVKVSDAETVSVSDLNAHLQTYQGSYVSLEGTVVFTMIGSSAAPGIPEGMGVLIVSDNQNSTAVVIAGECFSPPLDEHANALRSNDEVIVTAVPLRISMGFLTSTREYGEYYSKISDYVDELPDSAREKDAVGKWVAIWGARWLSADDIEDLSRQR
jgi:hypothetical protein